MSRRTLILLIAGLGLVAAPGAEAYLKIGIEVGGDTVPLKWTRQPIRYFVTNRGVPGVSANDLRVAVARAFETWSGVPSASVAAEFVGFTGADPGVEQDGSVIGFVSRPDLDTVLGSTQFVVDTTTGELLESDIFLNSAFDWSVAQQGEAFHYDVESIAAHEIGHLLGLSHSALGETEVRGRGRTVLGKRAVMFPLAYPPGNIADRTLEDDDVAGLSDIYGTSAFKTEFGSISGRVLLNGAGVFGAHVIAFNPNTGTLTAGFTLTAQGQFVIAGLEPGVYVVRAEPVDDADLDGFFSDETAVNTNFRPAYASSLVSVPAGGTRGSIEIRVSPK